MSASLKVTLIQSSLVWEDKQANLEMFSRKISKLNDKTDLIVLPEMFTTGFSMNPQKLGEPTDGPTLE